MLKRTLLVTAGALLAAPATSVAEPAIGLLRGGDAIVYFDTDQPAKVFSTLPVTGLATASERLVSLDYRYHAAEGATPAGLFGLSVDPAGTSIRLYRIDSGTGAATPVGPAVAVVVAGQRFGIDFNPTADRVRVVNENDENLRLNPNNGVLAGDDPNVTPAVSVTGVAYDRVDIAPASPPVPANSTAYAIDNTAGTLGTIGGLNQSPSPNGGAFTAIGPLGVTPDAGTQTDFDISRGVDESTPIESRPPKPVAVATITSGGVQRLYAVDLGTGAATAVGTTPAPLASIAVMPTQFAALGGQPRWLGHGNPLVSRAKEGENLTVSAARIDDLSSTMPVSWITTQGLTGTFQFEPGEAVKTVEIRTIRDGVARTDEAWGSVLLFPGPVPFRNGGGQSFALANVDENWPPAPPADVSKPTIKLGKLPKSVTYKQLTTKHGLKFSVTPSEAASITATLLASVKGTLRKKPFSVTVVDRILPVADGARTVALKPTRKELRRPKSTLKLKLRIEVVDRAGNARTQTRTLKVKPR